MHRPFFPEDDTNLPRRSLAVHDCCQIGGLWLLERRDVGVEYVRVIIVVQAVTGGGINDGANTTAVGVISVSGHRPRKRPHGVVWRVGGSGGAQRYGKRFTATDKAAERVEDLLVYIDTRCAIICTSDNARQAYLSNEVHFLIMSSLRCRAAPAEVFSSSFNPAGICSMFAGRWLLSTYATAPNVIRRWLAGRALTAVRLPDTWEMFPHVA